MQEPNPIVLFDLWTSLEQREGRAMKRIAALTAVALGFVLVGSTYADVTGNTYHVTVVSSFGTTFTDCFRFDNPGAGDLTIDLLLQTITYRRGQLDAVGTRFKSVSRSGQPLSITFYGEELTALTQLNGEAVNEFGDTFVFSGSLTAACVPSAGATSPYLAR
jgi:hypothetical protein